MLRDVIFFGYHLVDGRYACLGRVCAVYLFVVIIQTIRRLQVSMTAIKEVASAML
jgi:hypothetical protein